MSIQAQILNLMEDLQEQMGLTYMFITHDLSVVNHFSDDIAVMYLGKLIEKAPSDELFKNPTHPYTQALLSAIPLPNIHKKLDRILLKGEITSPIEPKPVWPFCKPLQLRHRPLPERRASAEGDQPGPFRLLLPGRIRDFLKYRKADATKVASAFFFARNTGIIALWFMGMDCFCIFAKKEGVEQRKIIRQEGKVWSGF